MPQWQGCRGHVGLCKVLGSPQNSLADDHHFPYRHGTAMKVNHKFPDTTIVDLPTMYCWYHTIGISPNSSGISVNIPTPLLDCYCCPYWWYIPLNPHYFVDLSTVHILLTINVDSNQQRPIFKVSKCSITPIFKFRYR